MNMSMPLPVPRSRRPVRGILPHLVWEAVLLLAVLAVGVTIAVQHSKVYSFGTPWPSIASLGVLATGLALSFRTATPNLAVSLIAAVSGWVCVKLDSDGTSLVSAGAVGVLLALAIGVVLGVIVGLTSMPGWAVTLAAGFVLQGALAFGANDDYSATIPGTGPKNDDFIAGVVAFAVVSVGGGVLFAAVPQLRAVLSANRPEEDGVPGRWRVGKLIGALVGLAGSSAAAGLAGVLVVAYTRAGQRSDIGLLPYALAAVVLGGVSVFGRRAGVFGVLLGVLLVQLVRVWEGVEGAGFGLVMLTPALFLLLGLGVNRLLEWLDPLVERPPGPFAPQPSPMQPSPTQQQMPWQPGPGFAPVPAQPAGPAGPAPDTAAQPPPPSWPPPTP